MKTDLWSGLVIVPALMVVTVTAAAQDTAQSDAQREGYRIAKEMTDRDKGFQSYQMKFQMQLTDRQGDSSVRKVRGMVLEVPGDGDRNLTVFDSPGDVRGTAFLSYAHPTRADDQWLYLPALKRTKRIAVESQSGSFVGSEFSFEDLTAQELEKFRYRFNGEGTYEGRKVLKLTRLPVYQGTGYRRQEVLVDSDRYIPLKIDYYDRRDALLKTLVFKGYQAYEGHFWKADEMMMVNHQNGKSTRLTFSDYDFRANIPARSFDPRRLEFVR